MPVEVSIELVLKLPDPEAFLPSELVSLIRAMDKDKNAWLPTADWFEEHDEPGLARACRYAIKKGLEAKRNNGSSGAYLWKWDSLPPSLLAITVHRSGYTLGGILVELADALRKHDEEGAS